MRTAAKSVVNLNKPKALTGLSQKASDRLSPFPLELRGHGIAGIKAEPKLPVSFV